MGVRNGAEPHLAYGALPPCNKRIEILYVHESLQMGQTTHGYDFDKP